MIQAMALEAEPSAERSTKFSESLLSFENTAGAVLDAPDEAQHFSRI